MVSSGDLWSRLGSTDEDSSRTGRHGRTANSGTSGFFSASGGGGGENTRKRADRGEVQEGVVENDGEDDTTLQKMWGAMIKQKQEKVSHQMKKSRLDNLPSLQIEISRDSSEDSDA